jgi:Rrf2 family protein
MRLRFSRRTDYALRAALELAGRDGMVKRAEIAESIQAPPSVMAQALADLVRAGLAVAVAGRRGGYRLARPADQITVLDVVRAMDPDPAPVRCVLRDQVCSWDGPCPLHATMADAQEAFAARLDAATLADIARVTPALAPVA